VSTPDLIAPAQPACPVCNRALAPAQSWCLECGAAARTRIAPTPRWRPIALLTAFAALLAIIAIGFAIARLARGSTSPGTTAAPPAAQVGTTATPPARQVGTPAPAATP
jgi:hypothetical protein